MDNSNKILPVIIFILLLLGAIIFLIWRAEVNITPKLFDRVSCYWDNTYAEQPHQARETHAKDSTEFTIAAGQSVNEIAQQLTEADLLDKPEYFVCYVKKAGVSEKIQAGYYKLPYTLNIVELAQSLQQASIPSVQITIPEGLMMSEIGTIIDRSLKNYTKFDKSEFTKLTKDSTFIKTIPFVQNKKSLEGYLFPDTYEFKTSDTAQDVILTMTNNFQAKILTKYAQDLSSSQYSTYQIINMASIIEREARSEKDRKMVADILWRRLKDRWTLDVDATLLYYHKDWKHKLTTQDLQSNNDYNTRKHQGLPPTPICNPGEQSIRAALYPASNSYWFYISDNKGIMHYAKTLYEHNNNINKYLK